MPLPTGSAAPCFPWITGAHRNIVIPAATDDAWNATRWAAGQFGRVAVGGDSAGGNLAAAVALRARDHGLALALQMLVYPVLDGDLDAPYRNDFAKRNSDPVRPGSARPRLA